MEQFSELRVRLLLRCEIEIWELYTSHAFEPTISHNVRSQFHGQYEMSLGLCLTVQEY